jgi:hypothetical protein
MPTNEKATGRRDGFLLEQIFLSAGSVPLQDASQVGSVKAVVQSGIFGLPCLRQADAGKMLKKVTQFIPFADLRAR